MINRNIPRLPKVRVPHGPEARQSGARRPSSSHHVPIAHAATSAINTMKAAQPSCLPQRVSGARFHSQGVGKPTADGGAASRRGVGTFRPHCRLPMYPPASMLGREGPAPRPSRVTLSRETTMHVQKKFGAVLVAMAALAGASISSASLRGQRHNPDVSDQGRLDHWRSGGSSTLAFHGRPYPLTIGGISTGLVFGASKAKLSGKVSNIHKPSDLARVYGAAGAGAAVGSARSS